MGATAGKRSRWKEQTADEGGNGKARGPLSASLAEERANTLDMVAGLNELIDQTEGEKAGLVKQLREITDELKTRDRTEKQLNERIRDLERETSICADLQEKIVFQQKELSTCSDSIARLESRCDQLTAAKAGLEAEVSRLDNDLNTAYTHGKQLEAEIAKRQKACDAADERARSIEREFEASESKRKDLEAQLRNAKAEGHQSQLDLKLARQALTEIHDALATTTRRTTNAPGLDADRSVALYSRDGRSSREISPEIEEAKVGWSAAFGSGSNGSFR